MPSRLRVQHADRMEPAGPAEEVHLRGESAVPGGLAAVSLQTCPTTGIRKTIRGRILGSICAPFLRVTHSIRIFPLCASQALWGASPVFILFHHTTGYL